MILKILLLAFALVMLLKIIPEPKPKPKPKYDKFDDPLYKEWTTVFSKSYDAYNIYNTRNGWRTSDGLFHKSMEEAIKHQKEIFDQQNRSYYVICNEDLFFRKDLLILKDSICRIRISNNKKYIYVDNSTRMYAITDEELKEYFTLK